MRADLIETGMTRTITIASGKGGVGKTSVSVNVALQLAALGYKTCLFDADLGLANINIMLGLNPPRTVEDMILRGQSLTDIIMRDCDGIDIIPGSSGVEKMADLDDSHLEQLVHSFSGLDGYDFLLFDTSAGVSKHVIAFCLAASEVLLIITPEPTSLTDAYALLKILIRNGFEGKAKIVVNQCQSHEAAKAAYLKFRQAAKNYLQAEVVPLGFIFDDPRVVKSVNAQRPLLLQFPQSHASNCIKNIARNLLHNQPENLDKPGLGSFWQRCLQLMREPLTLEGLNKKQHEFALAEDTKPVSPPEKGACKKTGGIRLSGQTAAPPQPANPSGAESAPPNGSQDFVPLLQQLVKGISEVAHELRLLRQASENNGQSLKHNLRLAHGKEPEKAAKAITIDYEAFVRQQTPKEN